MCVEEIDFTDEMLQAGKATVHCACPNNSAIGATINLEVAPR
jgi:hypothetical protein